MSTRPIISLFLIDDHQMLIDGIKALLEHESEYQIVGTALNANDALEHLKRKQVDIVISDINMPDMNGIDFARKIRLIKPDLKILALSMFGEKSTIHDMVDAGVKGYILKNTGKQELITALQKIASGGTYFSEAVDAELNRVDDTIDRRFVLTVREREIVKYIAKGMSHTEIGEVLCISPRTVDTHRTNLMRKLEVNSIAELIKLAIQLKLID
ncbi:MAG: response regulator transcription factor [Bacteroidia bacterium]|jgi:DNA-binding NarL/FixJ family response regulator|nr:response regulator transcription factor [Bacteroidia bacterium]